MDRLWELERKSPRVLVLLDYVRLTGDLAAGILLSQVVYWFRPAKNGHSKLRVKKNGVLWLAKTWKELQDECRLTVWQVRTRLDKLRKRGFLLVEVHRFNGFPTLHIRPNFELIESELKSKESSVIEESSTSVIEESSRTLTETTSTESTNVSSIVAFHATDGEKENHGEEAMREGKLVTVGEVLKMKLEQREVVKKKPAPPLQVNADETTKSYALSAVANRWKKHVHLLTNSYVKDLTGKERGQLKLLMKALEDQTVPVMDYALQNWATFVFEVKVKKGVESAPTQPVVGFLLAHHDVVVNIMMGLENKQAKVKLPTVAETLAPKFEKKEKHQVSKEMILAALEAVQKAKSES